MIGVIAKASINSEAVEAFEKSAQQLVETTRAQDAGCLSYDFGAVVEEGSEGEYAFLERWESQEALDAHSNSAHFKEAMSEWENYLSEPLEVRTYEF